MPWRNRPSELFPMFLEAAQDVRMFILQENGPSKFVVEEPGRLKYKVEIGNSVKCSCGGGVTEHCIHIVHTLFLVSAKFRRYTSCSRSSDSSPTTR